MSINNELTVKTKLNFFQRLRKSLLIRNINYKKFKKSPEYLKQDSEVILALVSKEPEKIDNFEIPKQIELLQENVDLFDKLNIRKKYEIIEAEPNFIKKLTDEQALIFISAESYKKDNYIRLLSEELQYKILTIKDFNNQKIKLNNLNYAQKLDYFSPNVVEKVIIQYVIKQRYTPEKSIEEFLNRINIENLPFDLQLKIALLDDRFVERMSKEAIKKYIGTNPLLLKTLSIENIALIIQEKPSLFNTLDYKMQWDIIKNYPNLINLISDEEKLNYLNLPEIENPNSLKIKDEHSIKKHIISNKHIISFGKIFNHIENKNIITDLARFEPTILSTRGLDFYSALNKIESINNLYKSLIDSQEVINELDQLHNKKFKSTLERDETIENLPKVLLNKNILQSIDSNLLLDFIKEPFNREILENIVKQTYGDNAYKILKNRPELTLKQIKCLEIFDPIIVEKFGEGTVNNMLTYDTPAPKILGELVRNPDKMQQFEEFINIFELENNTALDFNNKLIAYQKFEKLILNINFKDLTETQKYNLILSTNDLFMTKNDNETSIINLNTVEDLENYSSQREKMYDEYINKTSSAENIKDAITRRFFGMEYKPNVSEEYRKTNLSFNSMIYYYNLENFIKDERTINSGNFSEDELDILELAVIINKINDPNILKEIYDQLSKNKEFVLNPLICSNIREKIPVQYSKELVESLFTVENAKERIKNNEEGMEYTETEDGFEILTLKGSKFKIMLHSTGMNNSQLSIPYNSDVSDIWKYFEKGCSTVSCCLIEDEMLDSCANVGGINFGFSNIPPTQIIGMSHHDAHVTHNEQEIDPHFNFSSVLFNYPDELLRKTAAQITGQETKDQAHEYNEITMYRNFINSKSKEYGKRVMPDYIVVYGKATDKHKKIAKKFEKDGKPIPIIEIDLEAYGDKKHIRGNINRKENHEITRISNKIIDNIKKLSNKEEKDDKER